MILWLAAFVLPAAAAELQRFEAVESHMGTLVAIRIYAANAVTAQRGLEKAFNRIEQLDNLLSDYKADSEVSRLTAGKPTPVSPDLFTLLTTAQQIAAETDGAFDVTVGAQTRLWREARKAQRTLTEDERSQALARSGYRHLRLHSRDRSVLLEKEGMQLDLGGIAKGYAADAALAELHKFGLRRALVAISGDLAIGDPPPGKSGWQVEIAGGRVLELRNCGVSTSGDREQHWVIGAKRYSHIMDPRTAKPLETEREVTIVSDRSVISDAFATAMSVSGATYETPLTRRHRTRVYLVP